MNYWRTTLACRRGSGDQPARGGVTAVPGLNFVAIDFETANRERASVCQVGLTRVEDGLVSAEDSWYVVPPTGARDFDPWNIRIHHITPDTVASSGIDWEQSLERLESFAAGQTLVAHNARFDRGVYEAASRHLCLPVPAHRWEDTLVLSRRTLDLPDHKLTTVARHLGIEDFTHHDACADARACALVATSIARLNGVRDLDGLWPRSVRRTGSGSIPGGAGRFHSRGHSTPSAQMPRPDPDADPSNPLFGHHVVITGDLPGLDRWEVFQRLAARGATPQKGITHATSLLICAGRPGTPSDADLARGTGKERKAADYRSRGQSILLVGAREALAVLGD